MRASTSRRTCASARSTRRTRRPTRSRRRRSSIIYKDPCKAGLKKSTAQGLKTFLSYAPRTRARTTRQAAVLRAAAPSSSRPRARPGRRRCSATARRSAGADGGRPHSRWTATARSAGGRALRGCADPLFQTVLAVSPRSILVLIAFFFVFLLDEARPALSHQFGVLGFIFDERLGRRRKEIYGALPLRRRHADHLGDRAADRRADRRRHRAVPHRAVPAPLRAGR